MVHTSGGGDVSACVKQVEPMILRRLGRLGSAQGSTARTGLVLARSENDGIRRDAGPPLGHEGGDGGAVDC